MKKGLPRSHEEHEAPDVVQVIHPRNARLRSGMRGAVIDRFVCFVVNSVFLDVREV
jgi:hypothetical protein